MTALITVAAVLVLVGVFRFIGRDVRNTVRRNRRGW